MNKLSTRRNIGVIRSIVNHDTNGFLLLTIGLNIHEETFISFL
jgi:hypothetical protein